MSGAAWANLLLAVLAAASAGACAAAYRDGHARLAFALWTIVIVAISVPFPHLQTHSHWAKVIWVPFSPPLKPFDVIANVIVYVPWGFLWSAPRPGSHVSVRAAVPAAVLSTSVELIQVFSHMRFPSATDVVCNIAGAVLGAHAHGALTAPTHLVERS